MSDKPKQPKLRRMTKADIGRIVGHCVLEPHELTYPVKMPPALEAILPRTEDFPTVDRSVIEAETVECDCCGNETKFPYPCGDRSFCMMCLVGNQVPA